MNTNAISNKEKAELVKKVCRLMLSKKEERLFQKIQEKGFKNWNDDDIEFLNLLNDSHYFPILGFCGCSSYPYEQEIQIKKEFEEKRANATKRLAEKPYSLWFKNARNYK
jgi:hypothetical protein